MSDSTSSPRATSTADPAVDVGAEAGGVDAPAERRIPVTVDTRTAARVAAIALALVAAFLLALWLYGVVGHFFFLLLLAWLFAVALEPGILFFVRRGVSRGLAAAITGVLAVIVALVLIAVFGDLFFQQIAELVRNLPNAIRNGAQWVNSTFHTRIEPETLLSSLQIQPGQVTGLVGSLSGGIFGVVDSVASILLDLVTVLVFGFYMAAAGPRFLETIAKGLRPKAQRVFVTVADITAQKTGGYVGSKIVLAGLSALFHGILFAVIGVPYWLPFALLVGVTAQFIPLIGTYIGVLLPVLATAFDTPWKAVVIIVFALVYQQIESYVFTPRVSQKTMDVNPAVALAAVFLGAAIWGPIGAVIGIPLAAAGVAIADTYSRRYELVPELAERIASESHQGSGSTKGPHRRKGTSGNAETDATAEPDAT